MQEMLAMMQAEMEQKAAAASVSSPATKTSGELGHPPSGKPPPPPVAARKPSFEGQCNVLTFSF